MIKIKFIPGFADHERFLAKICVDSETHCWNWKAATCRGYGIFSIKDKNHRAHRVSYEIFVEKINTELVLDHICKNRLCCNPLHLRKVTFRENVTENSDSTCAINKLKTHCLRGHELSEENTRIYTRNSLAVRECRKCRRIRATKARETIKNRKVL